MRDYSKVSGNFWTGRTGKVLRGDKEAQLVALYLVTCNHGNMIGVFHLPILYIAHETGLDIEGASKALARLIKGQFCTYDEDTELVWVHEAARFQIGERLSPGDKQVKGIQKQYDALPSGLIKSGFFSKYRESFHMIESGEKRLASVSPFEAPTKPVAVAVAVTVPSTDNPSAKRKTKLPEDFTPNQTGIEKAKSSGINIPVELERFMDHHQAKGTLMLDWQAAWRTWIANAVRFGRASPSTQQAFDPCRGAL